MSSATIKFVSQLLPWKPKYGDILAGGYKHIKCLFKEEMLTEYDPILLTTIADFSWVALTRIGIPNADIMRRIFKYKCPWTDNTYYHFMPWLLLTKDKTRYKQPETSFGETAFDVGWTRDMVLPSYFSEIDGTAKKAVEKDSVTQAMLGHGYTECTLPYDGHGRHMICCLELNNGDLIAGWLFVWFNK